jgi:ketosteroid isomerase-like protein
MAKYWSIFSVIIMLIPAGCRQKVNSDSEELNIRNTMTDMWDAIEKHDIERYAKYVHKDFTQFGETDSILRVGKETEIKSIKEWMQHSINVHTEMHEPKITISDNVAWVVYYWSDSGFSDGKSFTSRGKSTRIFVKENGIWKCIHGHYTLLP